MNMSLSIWRAAALAAVLSSGLEFGCSQARNQASEAKAPAAAEKSEVKTAADFNLKDSTGADIKLADYKGKVVLLNFWATWCGPCKVEIPWFVEFSKAYKERGLVVVGVSMDDDGWKSVKPYIAEKKLNYPIVLGTDDLEKRYGGVDSLPTTFMIDRNGKIAFSHSGLEGKDTYEKEIQTLLNGPVAVASR
jgi:peroxiredoxin